MGTDYVELFDRRLAEIILRGTPEELATIVESRTRPLAAPPVWRDYFDSQSQSHAVFPEETPPL